MAVLRGTPKKNVLRGTNSADSIYGLGGGDALYGKNGNDRLYGGAGNDKLYGGNGKDKLYGGADRDSLYGGLGADQLYGGASNDLLVAGTGNDKLYGGAGFDTADYSWVATTSLFGQFPLGITVSSVAGSSIRTVKAGSSPATDTDQLSGVEAVVGTKFTDVMNGSDGNDTFYGGNSFDMLFGSLGNDTLYGGPDNDTVEGYLGIDTLIGDTGSDEFRFGSLISVNNVLTNQADTGVGAGNRDIVRDFRGFEGDKISVQQWISDIINPNNPFTFIGTNPIGTVIGGEVRFQLFDNAGTENDFTLIQVEVGGDGDGVVDFEIELVGLHNLIQQNFIL